MKEIPLTWLVAFIFSGLVILRAFGIDSYTTAALGLIVGWLTGKHVESAKILNSFTTSNGKKN